MSTLILNYPGSSVDGLIVATGTSVGVAPSPDTSHPLKGEGLPRSGNASCLHRIVHTAGEGLKAPVLQRVF